MFVCVCVCVCVCVYVGRHVAMCVRVCGCVCVYVSIFLNMELAYACLYVRMRAHPASDFCVCA